MATWQYADYITLDGTDRLTRLRLHIQEVSQHVMGTGARSKSVTAVDSNYLESLRTEETRLTDRRDGRDFARNVTRFGRGDG